MKKKILISMLAVVAVGVVPLSAYASNLKATEVLADHEIVKEESENGKVSEYGLVSYENQTTDMETSGCSTGTHKNIVYDETSETVLIHGEVHPSYCTLKTTKNWTCTACDSTGHDDEYSLVWCTSPDNSVEMVEQ